MERKVGKLIIIVFYGDNSSDDDDNSDDYLLNIKSYDCRDDSITLIFACSCCYKQVKSDCL